VRAHITLLYLFDVAESVEIGRAAAAIPAANQESRAADASPNVHYPNPPLTFSGADVDAPRVNGLDARVRVYDYGVISLAFTQTFEGAWPELVALGATLIDNGPFDAEAEACCRVVVNRLADAFHQPREAFLSEDYAVFAVSPEAGVDGARVLAEHGPEIARLLRGEARALSAQETEEALRHRISYLTDDLVIPTWNAAFVYDDMAGSETAVEIMEFGNSQLLQFRYYDQLLDGQLARLYDELQQRRRPYLFSARRYTRAARQVHSLSIDVRELLDRTENALKFVGDIYAARLFGLISGRLGLDRWRGHVRDKLTTLDEIYHFAVEQSSIARGELLELTIIAILVLELVLFFLGIMK
jgi:hypothetical protein